MPPGRHAVFLGGGVPKDFIQITATSVRPSAGTPSPAHLAAIQITTTTPSSGARRRLGRQRVHLVGQEAVDGLNVMLFADVTIALLLCQGPVRALRAGHARRARAMIQHDLAAVLDG